MPLFYTILLLCLLGWTVAAKKLTPAAAATAGVLAVLIFIGAGLTGIALLGAFFFLGTAVTAWRKKDKIAGGFARPESSRRRAGQVLANGGVAGLLGAAAMAWPQQQALFILMMAGAFSAAAADTCASELGVLYGQRFFNIRTFKKDQNGLDGVVSLEGTLCGVVGSLMLVLVYCSTAHNTKYLLPLIVAGTAGNFADSWLGATVERKGMIGNNMVNAANTTTGALVAALWWRA